MIVQISDTALYKK